ncbi:methyltransferase family protein [Nocardia stercoris]|uniref:Isoprenylcysteine carboxylmethyltransferase family protein n=1 Tax=Nocardia stercoris TaxID=2483361 RepID=A0A3M2KYB9_9NOCA|nr:isoprenylcysteine carboxylmethyltransferase family protein [Nocardia stercoris]RMI30517.1 isoprenylcysteine carboxylmethyltransferase family protein [Nocardia stercoris]
MNLAVVTTWVWLALEIGLRVRDRLRGTGSTAADGGTRLTIGLLMAVAMTTANLAAIFLPAESPLRFPGTSLPWLVVGTTLMWLGLVVRVWAITVLGKHFRTTVEVDAGQPVIDHGPYHWIRHPSYTGLLGLTFGFGLASDNYVSLLLTTVIPTYALLRRIALEERTLVDTLGSPYETYRDSTKRLIPGVW